MSETKISGFTLIAAATIVLITIFFEYTLGWIGVERPAERIPMFMFTNWETLSRIWSWQTFGNALFFVSYILLIKQSNGLESLIWAILILCGIMLVVSMGITLGSYEPALSIYNEQPEMFNTIRGIIRPLYNSGKFGSALLTLIYLIQLFKSDGVIPRKPGITVLVIVIGVMIIGSFAGISTKVTGASWFLLPILLGFSYSKKA